MAYILCINICLIKPTDFIRIYKWLLDSTEEIIDNGTINGESNRKNYINKRFKVVNIYHFYVFTIQTLKNILPDSTLFVFEAPWSNCTFWIE